MNHPLPEESQRQSEIDRIVSEARRRIESGGEVPTGYAERYPHLMPELGDAIESVVAEYAANNAKNGARNSAAIADTVSLQQDAGPAGDTPNRRPGKGSDVERTIGDYLLLEELGRGGMGVVYKARQLSLNRLVAVKLISPKNLPTADDIARFKTEAESVARLGSHRNIVSIFEAGEHEGRSYFAMEYVPGTNLARKIRGEILGGREAAQLMATLAEAVHYAHERGVVHRDLKPANILIAEDGTLKVTDFGLAKQMEQEAKLTITGAIVGTPSYMSPEQARAENVDARTDIYSLGTILYELLTGSPPFRSGDVVETLRQVRETEPIAPRRINPRVDRDLETICLKCLEKQATSRYKTADELRQDLQRFLDGRPVLAKPVSKLEHAWRWCRRNPLAATLLVLLAALGIAGPLVAANQTRLRSIAETREKEAVDAKNDADLARSEEATQRGIAESEANKARKAEAEQRKTAEELRESVGELRRRLMAANLMEASRLINSRQAVAEPRVLQLLETALPPDDQLDIRGFAWSHLWQYCHPGQSTLAGHSDRTNCLAFSPDGQTLASGGNDGLVVLWNPMSGEKIAELVGHESPHPVPREVKCLAFSPDGRRLASGASDHMVIVWNMATHQSEMKLKVNGNANGVVNDLAFNSTGTELVSVGKPYSPLGKPQAGELIVWNLEKQEAATKYTDLEHELRSVIYSPAGDLFAAVTHVEYGRQGSPQILLYDSGTHEQTRTIGPLRTTRVNRARFSPEGDAILVACSKDGLTAELLWCDLEEDAPRSLVTNDERGFPSPLSYQAEISDFQFLGSAKTLAIVDKGGTVAVLDLPSGKKTMTAGKTGPGGSAMAVAPKLGLTATVGVQGKIHLWNLERQDRPPTISVDQTDIQWVRFTPSGELMIVCVRRVGAEYQQDCLIWNPADGTQRSLLQTPGPPPPPKLSDGLPFALSVSGSMLALADAEGTCRVWKTEDGSLVAEISDFQRIASLDFSPDEKSIAVSGIHRERRPGGFEVFSLATGESLLVPRIENAEHFGRLLGKTNEVLFIPRENLVVSCGERKGAAIWDATSGKAVREIGSDHRSIRALTLSPDGNHLAVGGSDTEGHGTGVISIWNVQTWENEHRLLGHGRGVTSVAYSSDGMTLASASDDGAVRVWDAAVGQLQLLLEGDAGVIRSLDFSPDESMLAAAGEDGVVRIWYAPSR